ncbi:MAG TPA: hypothetical protein GX707_10250 [Epulopiscium sp.]|nr:hypothetical protein [Candidatus Epulonipiscium sp.]
MGFVFVLTKYNDVSFKQQVSKVLEKRTELVSRNIHPQGWKYVDKMNSKENATEEVLKKRRSRYKIYGVLLLLLGVFLLIPSLMAPKEMLIPLVVGAFAACSGVLCFRPRKKFKKIKLTSFDKAAIKLFSEYAEIHTVKVTVSFTDDQVKLMENITIDYDEIEKVFITEDLLVLIWNERITVLQKKDLSSCNVEEFINFITNKSHNLFKVVDILHT